MNNETKTLQRIFVPYTYVRDMELFTNCNKLGDTPPGTEMRKIGGTAFPTKNLGKTPAHFVSIPKDALCTVKRDGAKEAMAAALASFNNLGDTYEGQED